MNGFELLNRMAPRSSIFEISNSVVSKLEDAGTEYKERPFLSIIIRTIGMRLGALKEVLLCLSGQECLDFEILLLGHNLKKEAEAALKEIIGHAPDVIQERLKFCAINEGNRTVPLNTGFMMAAGRYIAILDDDDMVFGNWVSAFYELYKEYDGRILHTYILKQDAADIVMDYRQEAVIASGGFQKEYLTDFNYIKMLRLNKCPIHSLAFPRWIYHKYGLRFDEDLTTTEDWDFILRAAFICGVGEKREVTGIYRWWQNSYSSRVEHDQDEWLLNRAKIEEKFKELYYVIPPKGIEQMVDVQIELEKTQHHLNVLGNAYDERVLCGKKLTEIRAMLNSASWKVTAPLRLKGYIRGIWKPLKCIEKFDYRQACIMHDKMLTSKSTLFANKIRSLIKSKKEA